MRCLLLGHRYIFLRQVRIPPDAFKPVPTRVDLFYCQRCLKYRDKPQTLPESGYWAGAYQQEDEAAAREYSRR
ncbi:MAG TPA: hypothetical protein VFA04_05025 [Bryobacteraceae bacterium]|nr:hypothetical protein [Bryobacteraceae bacterium]